MKKLFFTILLFSLLCGNFVLAQTAEEKADIIFFWNEGCPFCAAEKNFLAELKEKYPQVKIEDHEFAKNIDLVKELYQEYNVSSREQGFVPVTFTPDKYFVGFNSQIAEGIESCLQECIGGEEASATGGMRIPFLGEINIKDLPIPLVAIMIGALDGFNVCSLGALVLILSLVLALRSKKKILLFGGIFILSTILIYGLLVFIWHQLFSFLAPFIGKMEIVIGLFSLAGAVYFFREFLKSRRTQAGCKVGGITEKFSHKIQAIFEKKSGILALGGAVLLFAAIVTVIEFPCTAFFPVLFAGIITEAGIPLSLSLFYISLYIIFYMLDEIIVLLMAVFTLKIWVASPKSTIYLNLLTCALLLFLSFYYLANIF
jgi:glutaredoxin